MENAEDQIAEFLSMYRAEIRSFAQELRVHLKKETKPGFELVGNSCRSLNIGYGFTRTAWDCYCAIIVYWKHINISLPSGASLSDPDGLLHGTGSRVRHLKVKKLQDLATKAVRKIWKEARDNAFALLENGRLPHGVETVIKTGSAKS